jgi:hypothetical protein
MRGKLIPFLFIGSDLSECGWVLQARKRIQEKHVKKIWYLCHCEFCHNNDESAVFIDFGDSMDRRRNRSGRSLESDN